MPQVLIAFAVIAGYALHRYRGMRHQMAVEHLHRVVNG